MENSRTTAPAPSRQALHEAALAHLARFAATEAGLRRVLHRRIARWSRAAAADPEQVAAEAVRARRDAAEVVAKLAAAGVVNDAAFAESRARGLNRAGRSRRAIAAHLAAKGVPADTAQAVLPEDPDAELAAALRHARRRRIGPFRAGDDNPQTLRRECAAMARAGFTADIAQRALRLPPESAEALILRRRSLGD